MPTRRLAGVGSCARFASSRSIQRSSSPQILRAIERNVSSAATTWVRAGAVLVSGAVVVILVAWQRQRRLAYLLAPVTGGLLIATVYGRFHYVLDTIAGASLAIVIVVAYRCLSGGVARAHSVRVGTVGVAGSER